MARFENSAKIDTIHMYGIKRQFFCPIGKSLCTYEIDIEIMPDKIICDYIEVGDFIKGMSMNHTVESACGGIYDYIIAEYKPAAVRVKVKCEDARHMPVEVTKNDGTDTLSRLMESNTCRIDKDNGKRYNTYY